MPARISLRVLNNTYRAFLFNVQKISSKMNEERRSNNNQLQVLKESELLGRQFKVYGSVEQPLFLAKDVAEMIEHTNPRMMLDVVDDDEKVVSNVYTLGGNQQARFLTEDGLYEVLMQSRKPIAKAFKKGVKTILKEIRTNGGYISTTMEDTPELIMARALQVAQRTIENHKLQLQMAQSQIDEQKHQIESLSPLADYTREVLQSDSTYTLTQIAKDLGYTSVHKFTYVLYANKILYKQSGQWMPTSKFAGRGFFSTRTAKFFHSDGSIGTSISIVITEKGRAFLHNRFRKEVNNE